MINGVIREITDDDEQVFTMPSGKPYEPDDEEARRVTRYNPQEEMIAMRSELCRLRDVEEAAKELVQWVESAAVYWDTCHLCQAENKGGTVMPLIHSPDCILSRALGLLKE